MPPVSEVAFWYQRQPSPPYASVPRVRYTMRGKRISDARRKEIRRLIGLGCTSKQVAQRMRVSQSFVTTLVGNTAEKVARRPSTGR